MALLEPQPSFGLTPFGGASSSIVALCVVVACFRRLSLLDVFHFGCRKPKTCLLIEPTTGEAGVERQAEENPSREQRRGARADATTARQLRGHHQEVRPRGLLLRVCSASSGWLCPCLLQLLSFWDQVSLVTRVSTLASCLCTA